MPSAWHQAAAWNCGHYSTNSRATWHAIQMAMIVGCREFDLEHDPRMRKMKAEGGEFTIVKLQPLRSEQVDGALGNVCTDPSAVQATLKPVLATPLHLSMFLS